MMKKLVMMILVAAISGFGLYVLADEVKDKTDGSFVGFTAPKTVTSSFMGDDANSVVNDSFQGQNTYFAGDNSEKEQQGSTESAFAGDHNFVGNDYGK